MRRHSSDRGAAVVEFALVLPLLIAILIGTIAFGHAFHIQTVIDNAARDGVRVYTIGNDADPAAAARDTAIQSASPSIALTAAQIAVQPDPCTAGANARVTITLTDFQLLGGIGVVTLTGSGSMRCNG